MPSAASINPTGNQPAGGGYDPVVQVLAVAGFAEGLPYQAGVTGPADHSSNLAIRDYPPEGNKVDNV